MKTCTVYLHLEYTGCLKKTPEFSCITKTVVTCKPCNGFTNSFFFSWKLRSLQKFWIQNQFCMISKQNGTFVIGWCDRIKIFLFWTAAYFVRQSKQKKEYLNFLTSLNNFGPLTSNGQWVIWSNQGPVKDLFGYPEAILRPQALLPTSINLDFSSSEPHFVFSNISAP